MQKEENWFTSWFDSPYYHILYKDRDYREAELFMTHLTNYLNLPEQGTILDLACGKGRHAIFLNSLGYTVTGVDLSPNSIDYAKKFANKTLNFEVHDMSKPFNKSFDAVFNLFTSFGYFDQDEDNLNTLKSIQNNLNNTGFAVLDFMNVDYVINNLVPEEIKTINGIDFNIKRFLNEGYIIKEIRFNDEDQDYFFTEKVKAIRLDDFKAYFAEAKITLLDIFGDFKLNKYNNNTSERLIMIFK
jgi:SAM-dependent methyltransferase